MNAHNPPDPDDILISSLVYDLEANATNPDFNEAAQREFAHLAMKVFNHRREITNGDTSPDTHLRHAIQKT